MTHTSTIRFATIADLPEVIDLLLDLREGTFWKEAVPEPNRLQMRGWILAEGCNPNFAICVAEDGGHLIGLCGVNLIEHGLAPGVLFIAEWAWYVRPDYREDGVPMALWREVKAWAVARGAVGTVLGRWRYWGRQRHGEF